jgi:hypothetical protein
MQTCLCYDFHNYVKTFNTKHGERKILLYQKILLFFTLALSVPNGLTLVEFDFHS